MRPHTHKIPLDVTRVSSHLGGSMPSHMTLGLCSSVRHVLRINARAVPGTRYLARSWPAHVVSPISLVRPLVAHTTYVCVARYSSLLECCNRRRRAALYSSCGMVCTPSYGPCIMWPGIGML